MTDSSRKVFLAVFTLLQRTDPNRYVEKLADFHLRNVGVVYRVLLLRHGERWVVVVGGPLYQDHLEVLIKFLSSRGVEATRTDAISRASDAHYQVVGACSATVCVADSEGRELIIRSQEFCGTELSGDDLTLICDRLPRARAPRVLPI